MELGRFSLSLTIAGIGTLTIASMLIWLLLYEPVALAGALDQGDLSVVAQALGTALLEDSRGALPVSLSQTRLQAPGSRLRQLPDRQRLHRRSPPSAVPTAHGPPPTAYSLWTTKPGDERRAMLGSPAGDRSTVACRSP